MAAALSARVHYVDLGGLFYWTRRQLRLQQKFWDAGLTAVIGMGCSPGITNVLAAYANSWMDKITSIKIRIGAVDFKKREDGLRFSYSPQTIIEELTRPPWIWSAGRFLQTPPGKNWELTKFPDPVGEIWTLRTRHSEIATLPKSFPKRKVRYCDFKVGFERSFVREVKSRLQSGWTIGQFNQLLATDSQPDDYEISRVIINDEVAVDCHAKAKPEWNAGAGDIDTACPASIVAQMIAEGAVNRRGVLPPETAVPYQPFFAELEKRGMKIKIDHQA